MSEYCYVICPFVAVITCQILKFVIESLKSKRFIWGRLINGNGGMPSSHTSFSSSLMTLIGIKEGFSSPIFALAMIVTIVTAYDAMGVRWESGKQAEAINSLIDKLIKGKPKKAFKHLKEQLGHKPLEVFMGFLYGSFIGYLFYSII